MILKGSKRGSADDLAKHLMKAENEHIEVHEIRGFMSDSVRDALREANAISRGTKCSKFLFSLSLSPPEQEFAPVKAFEEAIETIEARLGLAGQPRIVLFHEKEGRRHAHCVWSRIDAKSMTAIDQPDFKLKLQDISRKLYLEHGWTMPDGLIDSALRNPLNFDRKEWFQAQRSGQDPRLIKALFQQCWTRSDSGKAFKQALEQRGYHLARGDRRGVVAVDLNGEVYAVARWSNVKTKDVTSRIGDLNALPSVADVQIKLAGLIRQKLSGFLDDLSDEFAKAAQTLEAKRRVMVERHRAERGKLQDQHDERGLKEAIERAARFRKGVLGLWDRVTGRFAKLRRRNEADTDASAARDASEKQAHIERHLLERQRLQDEIIRKRSLQSRELARTHRQIARANLPETRSLEPRLLNPQKRNRKLRGPTRLVSGP